MITLTWRKRVLPVKWNKGEDDRMIYYTSVIHKLRKELGIRAYV